MSSSYSSVRSNTDRPGGVGQTGIGAPDDSSRLPPHTSSSSHRCETIDDVMREDEEVEMDEDLYGSAAYVWEQELDRSWDALVETDGVLTYKQNEGHEQRRAYATGGRGVDGSRGRDGKGGVAVVRRGMIRNLVILLDMSSSMRELDFRPDRLNCALDLTEEFIREFFQQNPIGQMGSLALIDSDAHLVQSLSASPEEQINKLKEAKRKALSGAPSLMNGLERALAILTSLPLYGSREVLIIFGSIRTCDAGNIEEVLPVLKTASVRVSCISMAPELYILKRICKETGGEFCVPCNKEHFQDALRQHTHPLPWTSSVQPSLVRMGFPHVKKSTTASLCICHRVPTYKGVICPQCGSKVCEVPTRCQLAASDPNSQAPYNCASCGKTFRKGGGQCVECEAIVCCECDIYSHDQLHHCPHCMMRDISKQT
eukprot:GHVS01090348.1.p1 GENE.GHVS01090348.1~~GHVS01090348.1.p1  ORF type:complete len:428 (+),score=59.66 GHVS01090348.1:105-1388(+)